MVLVQVGMAALEEVEVMDQQSITTTLGVANITQDKPLPLQVPVHLGKETQVDMEAAVEPGGPVVALAALVFLALSPTTHSLVEAAGEIAPTTLAQPLVALVVVALVVVALAQPIQAAGAAAVVAMYFLETQVRQVMYRIPTTQTILVEMVDRAS